MKACGKNPKYESAPRNASVSHRITFRKFGQIFIAHSTGEKAVMQGSKWYENP